MEQGRWLHLVPGLLGLGGRRSDWRGSDTIFPELSVTVTVADDVDITVGFCDDVCDDFTYDDGHRDNVDDDFTDDVDDPD